VCVRVTELAPGAGFTEVSLKRQVFASNEIIFAVSRGVPYR